MALRMLQADEIESLNEGSRTANIVREHYYNTLANCLHQHHWTFATKKASLQPLANCPVSEFQYAYKLPTDELEIINISGPGGVATQHYTVVSGNVLCTDTPAPLDIFYLYRPPVAYMPAYFIDYFVEALAEELAAVFGYNLEGQRMFHERIYGREGKLGLAIRRDIMNHPRPSRPMIYDSIGGSRLW